MTKYSRSRGVSCKKKKLLPLKPGMYYKQAVKIRTHDDRTIWSLLKEYINGLENNFLFNRNDLLSCIYIEEVVAPITKYETTVDQYRRYLTIAKVIEKISNGKYKKLKNIPKKLTINKLKNHVSGDTWKVWFIPIEDL